MTAWHEFAGTVVIQVSAIALVALILSACYSRSAARRHTVGVVGLLLILLSPLATPLLPQAQWWRVLTSTEESSVPVVVEPQTDDFSPDVEPPFVMTSDDIGVHERSDDAAAFSPDVGPVDVATPIRDQPPIIAAAVDAPANGSSNWVGLVNLVLTVWGAGSVVSAGIWFARRRRLQRLTRSLDVRPGNEIDGRLQSVVRDVCSAMRIEKLPAIAVSHAVPMPLVLGVWRPVIVIPADLLRDGAEQRLKEVLIHEAAHVVRRDAAINAAQRFVSVLWWWHPLVLWLNRVVSRSREEVCDNHVLGLGDARHYAETLLDLAETCSRAGRIAPSLGLLGTRWTLEKRIQGLLNPRRNMMTRTNCTIAVMFAVFLGMIALLVGGTVTKEPSTVAQVEEWNPARDEPGKSLQKVTVRGRCVDEGGSPLADVRVVMVRRSDDYTAHAILGGKTTDNEGRFEFVDVGTAMPKHGDLVVAAALEGYVSGLAYLKNTDGDVIEQEIELGSNPGTLSGVVRDDAGNPIPGVTVYLSCGIEEPIPGIRSAMTDKDGRYAITDLNRWTSESTQQFDPKTGMGTMTAGCYFYLQHPDYPISRAMNSAVPQEVDVTLYSPAIVDGTVIDTVTNEPAADVLVSAQGVAEYGWYQTRTDVEGHYRLRMVRDHYNIWADQDDRIAIAVKAIEAIPGKTAADADIRLVRGGFVVGTVFAVDGKPLDPSAEEHEYAQHVAHYGPARPRTGAAVTSAPIEADGTYRLRVAPGENYIYCMGGKGSRGKFQVEDGEEVTFDIDLSAKPGHEPEDEDVQLGRKLREAAREEDEASESVDPRREVPRPASQKPKAPSKREGAGATRSDEALLKKIASTWRVRHQSIKTAQFSWKQVIDEIEPGVERAPGNAPPKVVEQSVSALVIGEGLNIRHEFRLPQTPAELSGEFGVRRSAQTNTFDGTTNRQFTTANAGDADDWPRGIVWHDAAFDELRNYLLRAMLLHYRPLYPTIELTSDRLKFVKVEKIDGHVCAVIETKHAHTADLIERYWVDLSRDYVIVKHVEEHKGQPGTMLTIAYSKDPDQGWRPAKWELEFTSGTLHATAELLTHEINPQLPASTFAFDFPRGTVVFDRDAGHRYLVLPFGEKRIITEEESQNGFNYRELMSSVRADDIQQLSVHINDGVATISATKNFEATLIQSIIGGLQEAGIEKFAMKTGELSKKADDDKMSIDIRIDGKSAELSPSKDFPSNALEAVIAALSKGGVKKVSFSVPEGDDKKPAATLQPEDSAPASDDSKEESSSTSQNPTARKRPDTPTGRLLDKLAEQNASRDERFHDQWCKTLMQIVVLGPEAVPELIAELDATDNDMMLRCLGFLLRAIDDKRAVPALIRAIPKMLIPPGSDLGLLAEDEAIAAFMQRHDLSDRDEPMRYDFGRPVREIFGALHQLTGQSFDEQELNFVHLEGTEQQRSLKRDLFARTAARWAEWWEQHWSEFIQDKSYANVNLPKSKPAKPSSPFEVNQHFQAIGGTGNAMLESYTQAEHDYAFYDIDTGRYAGLPKRWQQADDVAAHLEEIVAWAGREGFDMMGVDYTDPSSGQSYYALRPIGLEAWELGDEYWKFASNDVTWEALQAKGSPAAELLLHYDAKAKAFDPAEKATFLIKTREGTPALLFVGIEVKDNSGKPGQGRFEGDSELNPVSFYKGRRFGLRQLEELPGTSKE